MIVLIELNSLSLRLGTKQIFENLNFKAEKGEKIGVIGGEGAGKSTFLDLIARREYPDSGKLNITGHIVNPNKDIYNFSELIRLSAVFSTRNAYDAIEPARNIRNTASLNANQ